MIFNNISFIGAGKVGTSLAKYFQSKGYNISGFYSKTESSLMDTCNFINTKSFSNLKDLAFNSDLIFITTPDDMISHIWKELAVTGNLEGKFISHCSGSLSSRIFSNINNYGAYEFSLHPLWAFSDKYNSYKNLNSAYFSLEGNNNKLHVMKDFLDSLSNNYFIIDSSNKSLYHAATVCVSNFVLSLIKQGVNYLELCGVDKIQAENALTPLIMNNLSNFNDMGLINSLTGPVERCDVGTITSHLNSIPSKDIELYRKLSINLLDLAKEKHKEKQYDNLEKILTEGI